MRDSRSAPEIKTRPLAQWTDGGKGLAVALLMCLTVLGGPASAQEGDTSLDADVAARFEHRHGVPEIQIDTPTRPCITKATPMRFPWSIQDDTGPPPPEGRTIHMEIHVFEDGLIQDVVEQRVTWHTSPHSESSTSANEPTVTVEPRFVNADTRLDLFMRYWEGPVIGPEHALAFGTIDFDCPDVPIVSPDLPCGIGVPLNLMAVLSNCDDPCEVIEELGNLGIITLDDFELLQLDQLDSICNPCLPTDPQCEPCISNCNPCPTGDCTPCPDCYQPEPPRGNRDPIHIGRNLGRSGFPIKGIGTCVPTLGGQGSISHISGEFVAELTPLGATADRGPPIRFDMTYRSQSPQATHGALGIRWDFNYGRNLDHDPLTKDVGFHDGQGVLRTYRFDSANGTYDSPPGIYDILDVQKSGSTVTTMTLTDRYGSVETYDGAGRLREVRDRNQQAVTLTYDTSNRLEHVTDAHGRSLNITYDASDRIHTLEDWTHRMVTFHYDGAGDLVAMGLPEGITQTFTYSTDHQMLTIEDGEGNVYLTNHYDAFNRVIKQDEGLGSTTYAYNAANRTTYVADPNGNLVRFRYDPNGVIKEQKAYTNRDIRPGEPASYVTNYTHNKNLEHVLVEYPDGSVERSAFDENNTEYLSQGNLLRSTRVEPSGATLLPPRELVWTYTYESRFNQVQNSTPPNGNVDHEPPNGGNNTHGRYNTTRIYDYMEAWLGDVNGDGATTQANGNPIQVRHPVVNAAGAPFPDASAAYLAQEGNETYTYNDHGQVVTYTNPEGLVELRQYHPEDHEHRGFLANVTIDYGTGIDPITGRPHRNEVTNATRDALGNPSSITDPSGDTTSFTYDTQCRVTRMQTTKTADTPTNITWDKNSQILSIATKLKAQENLTGRALYEYDEAGNLVREHRSAERPADAPLSATPVNITFEYGYDRKGSLVFTRSPEAVHGNQPANVHSIVYDERNQVHTMTRGGVTSQFASLPANSHVDITGSLVDRTTMATSTSTYDAGGRLSEVHDPNGHPSRYVYDGFGRQVARVDASGNVFGQSFDPNSNTIRSSVYEKGATESLLCMESLNDVLESVLNATSPLPDCTDQPVVPEYRLMSHQAWSHDERGRVYESRTLVFDPETGYCLPDANLTWEECQDISRSEHNRLGQWTRRIEVDDHSGHTHASTQVYDREGRPLRYTDALGNTVENDYDKAGNLANTTSTEANPEGWTQARKFTTRYTHDSWSRLLNVTDDLRHTTVRDYDVLGNVAAVRDANGQYTLSTYDAASRLIQTTHVMRTGDNGQHTFPFVMATPGQHTATVEDMHLEDLWKTGDGITVVGPAARFLVTPPAEVARNASFTFTVTAQDSADNTDDRYDGNVSFISSDPRATLPANHTYTASDEGRHSFTAKFQATGPQLIIAYNEFGVVGYASIHVGPGPLSGLQVLLPGEDPVPGPGAGRQGEPRPQLAGVPFSVTVRAVDDEWNLVPVDASLAWSSSDATATFSAEGLVGGEATIQATMASRGNQTLTASTAGATGTSTPLPVLYDGNLAFTTPAGVEAGSPFTFTLKAQDLDGNVLTDYEGTVSFGSSDPEATLPGNHTFTPSDAGVRQFTATFQTPGTHYLSAADVDSPFIYGDSRGVKATGNAATFRITAPATATSNQAYTVTVTARDLAGNVNPDYAGTVSFSSTDPYAILPGNHTYTTGDAGVKSFTVTSKRAGLEWLKVEDAANGIEQTIAVHVSPGPFTKLQVVLPGESPEPGSSTGKTGTPFDQQAYVPLKATVHAVDAQWNQVSSTDTVRLASSGLSDLPNDVALASGKATVSFQFQGCCSQTVTATDLTDGSKASSTSSTVVVESGDHLRITGIPETLHVGDPFLFTVTAKTATGQTKSDSSYDAFVQFENPPHTDPDDYDLPAQTWFNHDASRSFSGNRLHQPGFQAVYAFDSFADWGIAYVDVIGPAASLELGSAAHATAGSTVAVDVTARDVFGSEADLYRGTVEWVSSDPLATLPGDHAFTSADAGSHSFQATLRSPGHHFVAARDKATHTIAGIAHVTVNPDTPSSLKVLLPGEALAPYTPTGKVGTAVSQRADVPFEARIVAVDANGIPASSTATVTVTSSDTGATLPGPVTLQDGVALVPVTLSQGHEHTVTATAAGLAAGAGSVRVADGQYFTVTHAETSPAGKALFVEVTVRDRDGDPLASYTGSTAVYGLDGGSLLSDSHEFTPGDQGTHTFTLQPQVPGTMVLIVEEATGFVVPRVSSLWVTSPAVGLDAVAPASTTSVEPFTLSLRAFDFAGMTATDYEGTVHFASTDPQATLPADHTFTATDAGERDFTVALPTVGPQAITVTDQANGYSKTVFVHVYPGPFAKVQLLVPGESARPGTATGKTGEPLPQMEGVPFNVRVQAVDARWNAVHATDDVTITASDVDAGLPPTTSLVDGKAKLPVTLWSVGDHTLTATDADDAGIATDTSPAILVHAADVHFSLDHPDKVYAFEPFNVTVHAQDGDREQNITYTHEVRFKNSDKAGYTPPWYLFTMGINDPDRHGEVIGYVNTTLEYDADGRLVRQTDGQGNVMQYFYDELGRKIRDQYPDGSNETYGYDPGSNLVRQVDRMGNVIENTYDVLGRLVATEVTRASGVVGTDHKAFTYDALGRLTFALDAEHGRPESNHTLEKHYDSLGRVLAEVQDGVAVTSMYNMHDDREITYPSGYKVRYEYDELHRLKRVSDEEGTITEYAYIGPGRIHAKVSGNGINTTYAYDEAGRLEGVEATSAADRVMGFSYTRYPGGETFTALRDHLEDRSDALELDSLYRVVGFERGLLDAKARVVETPASGLQGQSWDLDDAMNWANTTQTLDGVSVVQTRSHNALNQVTSVDRDGTVENLTYDLNGNLVENTTMRFQWDYANRLREVERADGATIAVYEYDALNRRVSKNVTNTGSDGYTRYYHDGQHEIEEWSGSTQVEDALVLARYVYGSRTDEVLTMDRWAHSAPAIVAKVNAVSPVPVPPQGAVVEDVACVLPINGCGSSQRRRYYYHQDAQMTVHAITDSAGNVVEGYVYEPYGSVTVVKPGFSGQVEWSASDVVEEDGASGIGNPLQFTARRIDPETGLYQYRARYYSADLGRFVSSDPIGAWGDRGNLGNSYAYIGDSPYWSTDASGMHSDVTSWWVCEGSSYRDGNCRSSAPWSGDHCVDTVGGHTQQYTWHDENLDHAMTCTYRTTVESPAPQQNPQGQASSSEQATSKPQTSPPPETPSAPPSPPPPPPPPPPPMPQAPAKKTSLWGKFNDGANGAWDTTKMWLPKCVASQVNAATVISVLVPPALPYAAVTPTPGAKGSVCLDLENQNFCLSGGGFAAGSLGGGLTWSTPKPGWKATVLAGSFGPFGREWTVGRDGHDGDRTISADQDFFNPRKWKAGYEAGGLEYTRCKSW